MKLSHAGNISFSQIKNVVFDWGGVITRIDYQTTINAFSRLGVDHFDNQYTQLHQSDLFIQLEEGKIGPETFRQQLKKFIPKSVSDEQLDKAWSAMLLDTPAENIEILRGAKRNYRIFLLSNTNEIHVQHYNAVLKRKFGINGFVELFEKIYYSHITGIRKPDRRIFELISKENEIVPQETLFIDDTLPHIETAAALGWQTFHLKTPYTLKDLFDNGTNKN